MTVDTASTKPAASFRPDVLEVTAGGEGHLRGSRCPACEAHYFPARDVCARCLADLEPVALSTRGTVYTYTVIHQAAPGFEVPYVLGYVDLPEKVRVLGQMDVPPGEARIGMAVELFLVPEGEDEEGHRLMGYRFRPTEGGEG